MYFLCLPPKWHPGCSCLFFFKKKEGKKQVCKHFCYSILLDVFTGMQNELLVCLRLHAPDQ